MSHKTVTLRRTMAVASVVSLAVMAYIDYITGYDLVFSATYLLPVALCAWFLGKWETWLMSIAGGVTSWFVDRLSDHVYAHYSV